jgi:AraC-like DNA-binding protein/quercetin dioxygenase-like cupin family protein
MSPSPDAVVIQRIALPFTGGHALLKTYKPRLRLPPHSHDYAVLVLVLSGGFTETYARDEQTRAPGALRMLGPGELHSNDYGSDGAQALLLELPPATLSMLAERAITVAGAAHFPPDTWEARLARRMGEELQAGGAEAAVAIDALLLELLVHRARQSHQWRDQRCPRWLVRARELVHERFASQLSLLDLAVEVDVHPVTLARAFQRAFGHSPREYLEQVRVEHARAELADTDQSIAAIAAACGFYDQSHLTRRFRRLTGSTPAVFRAQTRSRRLPHSTRSSQWYA